jgi:hypothetical protein
MNDGPKLLLHIQEEDDNAKHGNWLFKIDDCGAAGRK